MDGPVTNKGGGVLLPKALRQGGVLSLLQIIVVTEEALHFRNVPFTSVAIAFAYNWSTFLSASFLINVKTSLGTN